MTAAEPRTRVAVLGGSGYTAVELLKILLRHPRAEVVAVTSRDRQPVSDYHPVLAGRIDLVCEPFDPDRLTKLGVEVAFGCLPHGESQKMVPAMLERGIRVIDLSADYRLKDAAAYAEWYGETHHDAGNLAGAVYGLPELPGAPDATTRLVANPGCYPQTAILALAPLLAAGLIEPTGIIVNSLSGVSGAGRSPKLATHFPECNESVSAYGVGTHRHTPEIEQALSRLIGRAVEVIFTPHLIPMDRGIFSTIYAAPTRPLADATLIETARHFYAGKPFVRVRQGLPATKDTVHTNFCDVTYRSVRGRVIALAAEDNLVRGASGVAVQNFNRIMGYDETMGLW